MKKLLLAILIAVLIVGGTAWYFVTYRMDAVIKDRIEMAGARSFGTRVSVGEVRTNVRDGSLEISNITVANPPGYRNPNAFSLDRIEAAVDYGSLDISRVVIDQPDIVIEEIGGRTNFSEMLRELESAETAGDDTGSEEPVIVIRHFRLNQSRAAFESASLDHYSNLQLDAVELKDIRGTPTEIARLIAKEVVSEIAAEAATEMVKAQAAKKFEDLQDKVTEKLQGLLGGDDPDD